MSNEILKSEFLVELSEQEQELVAGGFGPFKKPVPFGPPPVGPRPFGPPPFGPNKGFGGKVPFGPGSQEGFGDKGFDGSLFDGGDE
jgi:hypothetical protein